MVLTDIAMRILLIEDEKAISAMVNRGLTEAGFYVEVAGDGISGLALASGHPYSLIILDLMLPGMDGYKVCQELRSRRIQIPILMLTARDTVDDRIKGLDLGADDYLVKPFDFNELLARVRALLRREKVHRTRVIQIADLEIDTARRRVARGGHEIGLSHREYELLQALAANEGRVLTRETIQERVWMNDDRYSNMVDVYIRALRKKVDAGQKVKLLHTIRGAGYKLTAIESEDMV